MIENWFTTPIYVADLEGDELAGVQSELANVMPQIKESCTTALFNNSVITTFGFSKAFTDDIKQFQLTRFNQTIVKHRDAYTVGLNYQGDLFKTGGSWTSFYRKGGLHFDHMHPYSRIAGVYYYQSNEKDGNIKFLNPNPHIHYCGFPGDAISMETLSYAPKVGRILLFPGWLVHRVEMNTTDHERISIAFNFI